MSRDEDLPATSSLCSSGCQCHKRVNPGLLLPYNKINLGVLENQCWERSSQGRLRCGLLGFPSAFWYFYSVPAGPSIHREPAPLGCGSVPGLFGPSRRPELARMTYLTQRKFWLCWALSSQGHFCLVLVVLLELKSPLKIPLCSF